MRAWQTCKHYWKVIGHYSEAAKQARWIQGHALALCFHCNSFTVVDRDGLGPCSHSMGQRVGEQYFHGEPPMEKELETLTCAECGITSLEVKTKWYYDNQDKRDLCAACVPK